MPAKDIQLAPLTVTLDARSSADLMPAQSVRFRQNLRTIAENKLRRGAGWAKLLTQANYNNADFHDQLLTFGGIRQPITLIQEEESTDGARSLFIATQSKIARLAEHGGNWKILGTGYGGAATTSLVAPRFHAARVGDYVVFTNDFDAPMYHILGQVGVDGESLYEFDDLTSIGVTRARHVWSWRNMIILADIEADGRRVAYRLLSSSVDAPFEFDPFKATYSGFAKDLMSNERILGGMECGNGFLIYTDKNIWEMTIGSDGAVNFRVAYPAADNENKGTLAYPNTLVNTPDGHLYVGNDGIYLFNQYYSAPTRPEWLHRASSLILDNIDESACDVHVSGISGDEILISVVQTGDSAPSITLRINWAYKAVDVVDYGFTAFGHHNPQDIQTVRDFIVENRICTLAGLISLGYDYDMEGLPNPVPTGTAAFEPMSIHTTAVLQYGGTLTVASAGTAAANGTYVWSGTTGRYTKAANGYYIVTTTDGTTRAWKLYTNADVLQYSNVQTVAGTWGTTNGGSNPKPAVTLSADVVTTEDYERTANDANSLCALLGGELLDAGCRGCKGEVRFVAADAVDWTLKELGGVFYRETCANGTAVGSTTSNGYASAVGAYLLDPYSSIFRSAPLFIKEAGVKCSGLEIDCVAAPQAIPNYIGLRVGVSAQVADPNTDECRLVWYQHTLKLLKCISPQTVAQHRARGTMPSDVINWNFLRQGKILYFELRIDGTGGDCTLSRITSDIERYEISRY